MIDTDKFLDIVKNHHFRGEFTDGCGNFCLIGAMAVATDFWDFDKNHIRDNSTNADYVRLHQAVTKSIGEDFDGISEFNDDERVSHKEIIVVAENAVSDIS